jgi:hypothetical protein
MKHFVLSISFVFTLASSAQTPSVKRLVTLLRDGDINISAYADSLGYTEHTSTPQIGNMYEYIGDTYKKRDTSTTKSSIVYLSGHHYAMNQGPLLVSISYYTSSKTEFDTLVDEIKALGAKEFFYKDGDPYYHLYNYAGVNISTYQNNRGEGAKYRISLNTSYR